ncbi:MAG: DUF615 domain-containing protein [Desulfotalea sp.]
MSEYISKSEKKRRFKREELLADEISKLSGKILKSLPAEDDVKEVIKNCHGLKGSALKRQVKYLAKVMRGTTDLEPIFDFLAERKGSSLKADKLHKEAEHYRDNIINEALEDQKKSQAKGIPWGEDWEANEIVFLAERLSSISANELRRATYQYVKTKKHNHYKELFRMVKSALEREVREKLI